jgi:hypothetical protein
MLERLQVVIEDVGLWPVAGDWDGGIGCRVRLVRHRCHLQLCSGRCTRLLRVYMLILNSVAMWRFRQRCDIHSIASRRPNRISRAY